MLGIWVGFDGLDVFGGFSGPLDNLVNYHPPQFPGRKVLRRALAVKHHCVSEYEEEVAVKFRVIVAINALVESQLNCV